MSDDNDLLENVVVLDAPPYESPWLTPLVKPCSPVTVPIVRMTSVQIKKEIISRLKRELD